MATTALGRLTLDLAVRMSDFSEGMSRAARETADRTREMSESVTDFKDTLLESLSGTPIGGAIDSLNQKLDSITNAFGESGLSGAAKMGALAVGGAVAAMGAGLVTLALQTAEADKELVRLADRAKVSTKQLQVLTAATASYGIEADGLSDILADVQEKLGEFSATGGGGVVDTLELIEKITGKTATEMEKFGRDLSTKDSVEAIQMVNDALEDAGATTQETRFVTESLASGLGDIIPIWADNGKVIAEYEAILEKAGVIRTRESIEQSAILANQAAATKLQFQGLTNQLVAGTLPALSGLVEYMNSGSESADGVGKSLGFVGTVANSVTSFVIGLSTVFVSFGKVLGGVGALLGSFFKMVSGIVANPFSILDQVRDYMRESGAIGGFIVEDLNKELLRGGAAINSTWNPPKAANTIKPKVPVIANKGTAGQYDGTADAEDKAKEAASKAASKKSSTSNEPRLVGIAGNTGIGTGSHIDIRYANSDPRRHQKPSQDDVNRFLVNGRPLGSLTKTSDFNLSRKHPVTGKVKPHYGIDYDTEIGDKITTTSAVKDVKTWYDSSGGGWVTTTTFEDGLAMNILHQDPSVKGKVKSGASGASKGGSKSSSGSSMDSAQREIERKQEEDRRVEEARKLAGQNAIDSRLNESAKIDLQAKKDAEEAKRTLNDRPTDLATVLADIERNRVKAQKDLNDTVMKPFLTREDEINLEYEDRIYKSISAYGEGTEQQVKASKNAIIERDKKLADLREATLAPFRSEREQLGIALANDIKAVEALHGAGSDVANQATEFLKAKYDTEIRQLDYLAGEAQRQVAILSQNIGLSTRQSTDQLLDSQAQRNMKPEDFELYSATKSWERGRADQQGSYEAREAEINAVDSKGDFLYEAEDRNKLLEEAHEEHLARMALLDDEYANRTTEIAKSSASAKLDIEQTNVEAFGALAGALLGQQSTAAKAAFLISKAYTVQKILLEKGHFMATAYADARGGVFAKAAAAATAALKHGIFSDMVTQVAMPTFTGIAHGGMDYIPSESTFLLDKGERVLSPRQNKDLTDFLSKGGIGKGSGDTNISITIDNNGNANMNSDNAAKYSKELSLQVKNLVQASLRQEKRQGGML